MPFRVRVVTGRALGFVFKAWVSGITALGLRVWG